MEVSRESSLKDAKIWVYVLLGLSIFSGAIVQLVLSILILLWSQARIIWKDKRSICFYLAMLNVLLAIADFIILIIVFIKYLGTSDKESYNLTPLVLLLIAGILYVPGVILSFVAPMKIDTAYSLSTDRGSTDVLMQPDKHSI